MTKKFTLFRAVLALSFMLLGLKSSAQINYSQNFDGETIDWYNPGYFDTDNTFSCNGVSIYTNLYYLDDFEKDAYSMPIGISNGQEATLTYNFKLLDFETLEAFTGANWGTITVQYGTSLDGPWTAIDVISDADHTPSDICGLRTVSFTPPSGTNIHLRIVAEVNGNTETDALAFFDDVLVTQAASPGCTGVPAGVAITSSTTAACATQQINLALNPQAVSGLTYQWFSSLNGTDFSPIANATSATYTATQTQTTWYRLNVTCAAGQQTVTTNAVQVTSTGFPCYCDAVFDGGTEPITLVNFAGIDNASSAATSSPGMESFVSLAPAQVVAGQSYTITLKGNTNGNYTNYFTVYIDFNRDGDFVDQGEMFSVAGTLVNSTGTDSQQVTADIQIPATAQTGITVMRVFKLYNIAAIDPCDASEGLGYGQIEDYAINIAAPCSVPAPQAPGLQSFCGVATVSMLTASSNSGSVVWYSASEGGEPLAGSANLVSGIYYAAVITNVCESPRTQVDVTVDVVPAPEATADQVFCNGATIADFVINGNGTIAWYTTAQGGEPLSATTPLVNDVVYYVGQSFGECQSPRIAVSALVTTVPAPTGAATQDFVIGAEGLPIGQVVVQGTANGMIMWYATLQDALAQTNPLLETYTIMDSGTYYAVQTANGCASEPFAVRVNITLGTDNVAKANFKCYPNPATDVLNVSSSKPVVAVTVFNMLGQKVADFSNGNAAVSQYNIASLTAGTYLVKATDVSGASASFKVIKK